MALVPPQIFADQLTLSQLGGGNYVHHINTGPPNYQTLLRPSFENRVGICLSDDTKGNHCTLGLFCLGLFKTRNIAMYFTQQRDFQKKFQLTFFILMCILCGLHDRKRFFSKIPHWNSSWEPWGTTQVHGILNKNPCRIHGFFFLT